MTTLLIKQNIAKGIKEIHEKISLKLLIFLYQIKWKKINLNLLLK